MPASLRLIRGLTRQYRHDFEGALGDFAAALKLDPDLAAAHAWRGAIYLVQANYGAAQGECDALRRLGQNSLFGACFGLVQAYGGQLDAAYRTLQQALASTRDPGNRLWLLTRLGEVAAWRGQAAQAEKHYREALGLGRDDGYLLAAWGDFLLDAGRPDEVLKQLAGWEVSDGLLLRLAEAGAALKLPDAARLAQMLDDRFAAARQRGDTTHRAEEARYRLRLRGDAKRGRAPRGGKLPRPARTARRPHPARSGDCRRRSGGGAACARLAARQRLRGCAACGVWAKSRRWRCGDETAPLPVFPVALLSLPALAHKASDSYLVLDVSGRDVSGQWDIALRDIDFALGLDLDGNGEITWGELRARHADIDAWALGRLTLQRGGACTLRVADHLVDSHTDGAYAVLQLAGSCPAVDG